MDELILKIDDEKKFSAEYFLAKDSDGAMLNEETEEPAEKKEDKAKTDEEIEHEIGMKVEKEHADVYDLFKKFIEKNNLEMPITKDEYYDMVIKAHTKESKTYYRDLMQYVEKKKAE
jgi:hypothetical protein